MEISTLKICPVFKFDFQIHHSIDTIFVVLTMAVVEFIYARGTMIGEYQKVMAKSGD
jgi:hypothetical protein